jgi:hypothetical protein
MVRELVREEMTGSMVSPGCAFAFALACDRAWYCDRPWWVSARGADTDLEEGVKAGRGRGRGAACGCVSVSAVPSCNWSSA